MDTIDRDDLQWKIAMGYFLVGIASFIWWFFSQITIASGQYSLIPDPEMDLYRLILGSISFGVGIIRLRWHDIKYPTISSQ